MNDATANTEFEKLLSAIEQLPKPQIEHSPGLVRRFVQANAILVTPRSIPEIITADPKDNAILGCAIEGKAQYLVSGDEHLLQLGEHLGIRCQ